MATLRADGLWKRFQLQKDRADSVGQLVWRMLPGRRSIAVEPFWALRDVSFEMQEGQSMGIIGHNGAGKSTSLKLLTRTMTPTMGSLAVHGRVSALIELGAGFHPDFTGRENIILNASILGIRRRDIQRRMDDIIDFAGIGGFIDTPVKYYSSGMQARLGFSVAIHVDPEILIVDEVLAVGDEAFQQKCMDRIFDLKRSGVGILLVSHDLASVERLMDTAVWLDHGTVRAFGNPHDVVRAYRQSLRPEDVHGSTRSVSQQTLAGCVRILSGEISTSGGSTVSSGSSVELLVHVNNDATAIFHGFATVVLRRTDGLAIAELSSLADQLPLDIPPGTHRLILAIQTLPLTSGTYHADVTLLDIQSARVDARDPLLTFTVRSSTKQVGLIHVPHTWQVS